MTRFSYFFLLVAVSLLATCQVQGKDAAENTIDMGDNVMVKIEPEDEQSPQSAHNENNHMENQPKNENEDSGSNDQGSEQSNIIEESNQNTGPESNQQEANESNESEEQYENESNDEHNVEVPKTTTTTTPSTTTPTTTTTPKTTRSTTPTHTSPKHTTPYTGPPTTINPGSVEQHIEDSGTGYTYSCVFESSDGMPTFCGLVQSQDDDFDWSVGKGHTPSWPTGPRKAVSGEYYIFIEASSPRKANDTARIELPGVPKDQKYCLTFKYNMFGFHINRLRVYVSKGGTLEELWEMIGEQDEDWHDGNVEVFMGTNDKIVFEGVRGIAFSGDIALDNLKLTSC